MITALKTPAAGAVLLDANNTNIIVQSTNGAGHYFRAQIFINGIEFDTQGWSRIDAHTAVADLKKLYYAYFNPAFNQAFANGLTEQTHLQRQVKIVVKEYALGNDAVVASLELPTFTIMYAVKPVVFNQATAVQFLGLSGTNMVVPVNGKISLPVYIYTAAMRTLTVKLATGTGTVIDVQTTALVNGKKVFLYCFDLTGAGLSYNVTHLIVSATLNGSFGGASMNFRINRLPQYPVKEIAFRNNFGYYLYAYPDGELEVVNNFSPETFETVNGDDVFEVNEEAVYSINSGSYRTPEKAILTMVANSLDTWYKNGSNWLRLVTQTKKITTFKDRLHQHTAELLFKLRLGNDVENTGMITNASALPSIYITDGKVVGNQVYIIFEFSNGFNPAGLVLQFRKTSSMAWQSVPVPTPVSPFVFTITPDSYFMRLAELGNLQNISNQVAVNVI